MRLQLKWCQAAIERSTAINRQPFADTSWKRLFLTLGMMHFFQVEIGKDQKPTGDTFAAIGVSLTISSPWFTFPMRNLASILPCHCLPWFLVRRCWATFRTTRKQSWPSSSRTRCSEANLPRPFLPWNYTTPGRQRRSSLSPSLLCRACWCFWRPVWVDDNLWGPLL